MCSVSNTAGGCPWVLGDDDGRLVHDLIQISKLRAFLLIFVA